MVEVIAHRFGGEQTPNNRDRVSRSEEMLLLLPEHSESALVKWAASDPKVAGECDAFVCPNGRMPVTHDYGLRYLTGSVGNIYDTPPDVLEQLNFAAHFAGWGFERLLWLPGVLQIVATHRRRLIVETKTEASRDEGAKRKQFIARRFVDAFEEAEMLSSVRNISFDWRVLEEAKNRAPSLMTGALISQEWWESRRRSIEAVLRQVKDIGCGFIDVESILVSERIVDVDAVHAAGLKVVVWTEDDPAMAVRLARMGVDAITTNIPVVIIDALKEASIPVE